MSRESSESKETPPPSRAQSEWGEDRWSRRFSWGAFVGVVITFALAIFGDFSALGAWGFHLAVVGAAIVAMLLVAPSLFTASTAQRRSNHPDRDVRALANGEISIVEYRTRQEAKEKDVG
jgi:hypothetical protein